MEKLEGAKTKELPSILTTVLRGIQSELGNDVPYLPVIGNDDAIPDYFLDITDASPTSLLNIVSQAFLDTQTLTPHEAQMFARGGFYKKDIPGQGTNLTILCLNTVIYSTAHQPTTPAYNSDPLDQFTWLEEELGRALSEDRAVYVVGHIPPTNGMWSGNYHSLYKQIVQEYASTIRAQLFGHAHSDQFRLNDQMPPLFIGPALTPVYQNNPTFRVVSYDRTSGAILDLESHILNITDPSSNWTRLYSFREAYDLPDLSAKSLQSIVGRLPTNERLLRNLLFHFKSGVWTPEILQCLEDVEACAKQWVCLITSDTTAAFQHCFDGSSNSGSNNNTDQLWIGAGVAAVAGLLFSCLVFCSCRLRQRKYRYDMATVEVATSDDGDVELSLNVDLSTVEKELI